MPKSQDRVFLQLRCGTGGRELVGGELLALSANRYHGDFERGQIELAAEQNLLICRERNQRFVEEPVRVVSVDRAGDRVLVELEILGHHSPADSRSSMRHETDGEQIVTRLGGEECPVLDISDGGFAVYSRQRHALGQFIYAELHHGGRAYGGIVSVKNARELDDGRIRYGLECLRAEEAIQALPLNSELPCIHLEVSGEEPAGDEPLPA